MTRRISTVHGLGRISQAGSSETHYYLSDGLDSTMALTDEDEDVVNAYDYDVFGAVRNLTGSQPNDFTFASQQAGGSTGLQYLRARYNDPKAGRFISRDPISGVGSAYAFVSNRPITFIDPLGLLKIKVFGETVFDSEPVEKVAVVGGKALVNTFVDPVAEAFRPSHQILKEAGFNAEGLVSLDCAGFAIDLAAAAAVSTGAGVPLAAVLFTISLGLDGYQEDLLGGSVAFGSELVLPLTLDEFLEFSPRLGAAAKRVAAAGVAYSLADCVQGALN